MKQKFGYDEKKLYFTTYDNILMEELNNTCAVTLLLLSLYSLTGDKVFFSADTYILFLVLHILHLEKYGTIWEKCGIKENAAMFATISLCYD